MTPADEWETHTSLRRIAELLAEADRRAGGYARSVLRERNATLLFIAGLCRDIWPLLVDARRRQAVEKIELLLTGRPVGCFLEDILQAHVTPGRADPPPQTAQQFAAAVVGELESHNDPAFAESILRAPDSAAEAVRRSPRTPKGADYLRPFNGTDLVLCGRLRCLLANPFRPAPAFDPVWRSPTVTALAAAALADRDWSRLPVLADALEDAGCDAADLLAHARGPGPHVFGCRAVTACLGERPV